jgi:hypothetical protein
MSDTNQTAQDQNDDNDFERYMEAKFAEHGQKASAALENDFTQIQSRKPGRPKGGRLPPGTRVLTNAERQRRKYLRRKALGYHDVPVSLTDAEWKLLSRAAKQHAARHGDRPSLAAWIKGICIVAAQMELDD